MHLPDENMYMNDLFLNKYEKHVMIEGVFTVPH